MQSQQHRLYLPFQNLRRRGQPVSMDSQLLIGWQQEKAELQQEVSRLQEELAESRAERVELESRSRALHDRVRWMRWRGGDHVIITNIFISFSPSLPSCSSRCLPRSPSLCRRRLSRGSGGGGWGKGEKGRPDRLFSSTVCRTRWAPAGGRSGSSGGILLDWEDNVPED